MSQICLGDAAIVGAGYGTCLCLARLLVLLLSREAWSSRWLDCHVAIRILAFSVVWIVPVGAYLVLFNLLLRGDRCVRIDFPVLMAAAWGASLLLAAAQTCEASVKRASGVDVVGRSGCSVPLIGLVMGFVLSIAFTVGHGP